MKSMDDLRDRFIARFGAALADTIERVAEHHTMVIPGVLDRGSDPFRFTLVWAIGFECLSRPEFRVEHGIMAPWADLSAWIGEEADLRSFDGTMDLGARGRGLFDFALGPRTEADVAAGLEAADAWLLASIPMTAAT